MSALEKDEISINAGKMFLHAVLTAIKFYEKMGFRFEEECPEIILDSGVEVVTMVKEL